MTIPDDGLFPVFKMQENLEPLGYYSDNETSSEEHCTVRLAKAMFVSTSTWIPSRSSIVLQVLRVFWHVGLWDVIKITCSVLVT